MMDADAIPYYWPRETGSILRPAMEAYLQGNDLTDEQVTAIREYLRQWIACPLWAGDRVPELRERIDDLTGRLSIDEWLHDAIKEGIDPL